MDCFRVSSAAPAMPSWWNPGLCSPSPGGPPEVDTHTVKSSFCRCKHKGIRGMWQRLWMQKGMCLWHWKRRGMPRWWRWCVIVSIGENVNFTDDLEVVDEAWGGSCKIKRIRECTCCWVRIPSLCGCYRIWRRHNLHDDGLVDAWSHLLKKFKGTVIVTLD